VGILDVPTRSYELNHTTLIASPAHLFYSYHPATVSPESAPLFVLTGGGPGAAMLFMLAFTAPNSLVNLDKAPAVAPNAHPFTDLAHLLYIDARNAGLSWAEVQNPSDEVARRAEFDVRNYNVYLDAADVLSATFDFLDAHPDLATHRVYFVAESYGGARATAMVSFLYEHGEYAAERRAFHSRDLSDRIDRYVKEQIGDRPSTADLARRFPGQILIEPILSGARQNAAAGTLFEQPGSIIDQLAAAAGVSYARCSELGTSCVPFDNAQALVARINRSRYDYRTDAGWLSRLFALAAALGTKPPALAAVVGVDPMRLGDVLARKGAGAYRFGNPAYATSAVRGTTEQDWGALAPSDAYFSPLNYEVLSAFYAQSVRDTAADPRSDAFGDLFVRNVRYLPTMVTRADFDLEIYGPAVAPTLQTVPGVVRVTDLAATEELAIEFDDGGTRRIFSPWYHASSHEVARDEPGKLHDDIAAFLKR
jgi:hypothetical protein